MTTGDLAPPVRSRRRSRCGCCALAFLVTCVFFGFLGWRYVRHQWSPPAAAVPEPVPFTLADYPWPHPSGRYEAFANRIPPPRGFHRLPVADRSFAQWLRFLPLAPRGTPAIAWDGRVTHPGDAGFFAAVADLDVRRNQECADTIFRLRAEYLRWAGREGDISFSLGNGASLAWADWQRGVRPVLEGRKLVLHRTGTPGASRAEFDRYLAAVFNWCGTLSLPQDGDPVALADIRPGDFFDHGGSPGHAVLVLDVARNSAGVTKAVLLEGLRPAQTAHVPSLGPLGPWFAVQSRGPLNLAEYVTLSKSDLRRFRDPPAAPSR